MPGANRHLQGVFSLGPVGWVSWRTLLLWLMLSHIGIDVLDECVSSCQGAAREYPQLPTTTFNPGGMPRLCKRRHIHGIAGSHRRIFRLFSRAADMSAVSARRKCCGQHLGGIYKPDVCGNAPVLCINDVSHVRTLNHTDHVHNDLAQ